MPYSTAQLVDRIISAAQAAGIPPALAVEQLRKESANFRSDVVYGPYVAAAGERGLAQFTPGTWARFGVGMHANAYDPDASLSAWANYINYLRGLFGDDWNKVLIAYNGGEGHLINPARYGAPSKAAQQYAASILAKASQGTIPVDNDSADSDSGPGWSLGAIGLIGAASLLAIWLLDD